MKTTKRPVALMTAAQLLCALAIPLTLFFFLTPSAMLYTYYQKSYMLPDGAGLESPLLSGLYCLRDLSVGLCLFCAELEAIGIFGRSKKASAFSEKNMAALGRISMAIGFAGVLTLLFGDLLIPYLLSGLPAVSPVVERLLMPFLLLGIALMVRAVQLLVRRALTLQEETDLTV